MTIAWGSLVLLILLLPGILFFVGALLVERFTRDAEQRTPLGQLAGTLVIAFGVHGFLFAVLTHFCGGWMPCIDLRALLLVLNASPEFPGTIDDSARMLTAARWWILGYTVVTCGIGLVAGNVYGRLVVKRRLRGLTRHSWIYDLNAGDPSSAFATYAFVMTTVRHEERVLMYEGFLRDAGLRADGRFSYLVLRNVSRFYMTLGAKVPTTSRGESLHRIGDTGGQDMDPARPNHRAVPGSQILMIEGEDIANAYFERIAMIRREPISDFLKIVEQEREQLQKTIQQAISHLVSQTAGHRTMPAQTESPKPPPT